jgi:phospholipid-binding lipoprotein MlaA
MVSRIASLSMPLGLALLLQAAEFAGAAEKKHKADKPVSGPMGLPATNEADEFEGFEDMDKKAEAKKVPEPFYYWNKSWFWVNDKFYFYMAKPAARGYGFIVPQPVRVGVANAYHNLGSPLRMVNSGLQGKFNGAGRELGRLLVNSTLGVGGLFEVAEPWFGWKPSDEDFGQTLGFYGVPYMAPLVLPILGQSNLRDGIGMLGNAYVNPVYYVTDTWTYAGVTAGGYFNTLSLNIGKYESIKKDAIDPYTFIRDAHLQNREQRIKE